MTTRLNRWLAFAAALLIAACVGSVARAQEKPTLKTVPATPTVSIEGVDSYKAYCAVCHGVDGRGNGPAAPALKVPASDLTTIAQRRKGKFPSEEVRQIVVGDRTVPAHGSTDMPMWGPVFKSFTGGDEPAYKLRVRNLVTYLESIQVK
jgi:mono/diheme cytochrome c family protein